MTQTAQSKIIEEVESEIYPDERRAEMFRVVGPTTTNKAIADVKRVYADQYDMDKDNIISRKWESGWDRQEEELYMIIACSVVRGHD